MATQRANVNLGCITRGLVSIKGVVIILFSRIFKYLEKQRADEGALSCVEWLGHSQSFYWEKTQWDRRPSFLKERLFCEATKGS